MTSDDFSMSRAPRRRRWPWVIVFALVGVLVIGALAAGAYLWHLSTLFNQAEKLPDDQVFPTVRPVDTAPDDVNILLLGSDSRSGLADDLDSIRGQRADTIMLVHIPADRTGVQVISFMRDNWVEIPGYGTHKINATLAFGGVPLLVQTLESIVNVPIDHVAIIDFEGFSGLTDALGGVTVDNAKAFTSGGHSFDAGAITLDGEQALSFVRERHAFRDGDYQRVRNQQAFVKGLASTLLSRGTLSNPSRVAESVDAISPYLMVDADLTPQTIAPLALSMSSIRADDILFLTSPTLGTGTSADGQSIVLPDWDKLKLLSEALKNDTMPDYPSLP